MIHKIIYITVIVIIACVLLWFLINYFIIKKPQINSTVEKSLTEEGLSLFEEKKYEEAIGKYLEILTRFPESPNISKVLFSTGVSYSNLGKYDESITYFQKLTKEYPDSQEAPAALYELMVAYTEKGDVKNMQDSLIRLANRYPGAANVLFNNAKNIEMKVLPSVILQGAEALFKLKKTQEALNLYRLLLKDYYFDGDSVAKIMLGIGLCQEGLGDKTGAVASFLEIADKYPQNLYAPYALYYTARIYQDQKNYAKAGQYCKTILDNYPSAPQWILDKAGDCLQK
jgi:TolA-binding protein